MKVKLPNTDETFGFLDTNINDRWEIEYENLDYVEVFFENELEAKYAEESLSVVMK